MHCLAFSSTTARKRVWIVLIAALLTGCVDEQASDGDALASNANDPTTDILSVEPETNAPPSISLLASPTKVAYNGSTTLSWSTINADSCTATGDWSGTKDSGGKQNIDGLIADSEFELSCTGEGGTSQSWIRVSVEASAPSSKPAPSISLTANPSTVVYGGSTTLSWSTSNALSCIANGSWSGLKASSDSEKISGLSVNSTFELTCSGEGGTAGKSTTVIVGAPAPAVSLSAKPSSVDYQDGTILTWTSHNASSCVASGAWSGNKATSGSYKISGLTIDSTYVLTCSGSGGTTKKSTIVSVGPPKPASAPSIAISAEPSSIAYNDATTLTWSATDATSCTASGAWSGFKALSGNQNVSGLTSDSVFTLTCTGEGGTTSNSTTVVVNTPPPSVSLAASPSSVDYNGQTTLTWSSINATGCTASGAWSGSKGTSGTQKVTGLTADSTFKLTCTGESGSNNKSTKVIVAAPTPTVTLSANPLSVSYNGSATLSWSSTSATSCSATGAWTGTKATSGSQNVSGLTAASTFILTCSGEGGTANKSVKVIVGAPAPTVSISANPSNIIYNGATTLAWTTTNATSCSSSGAWTGSKSTSGSQKVSGLTENSTFKLSCSGVGGTASESVAVAVSAPPPTVSLSANPDQIEYNGSTTLTWNASDATTCTATDDWSGNKSLSGSKTFSNLSSDAKYTLSCDGAGGSDYQTVYVTVSPPELGSATLTWTPPTTYENGDPLTDLAGYKIYYGTNPNAYSEEITLNNPGLASYIIDDLSPNTYYFAIKAFNSSNIESKFSNEASKTI